MTKYELILFLLSALSFIHLIRLWLKMKSIQVESKDVEVSYKPPKPSEVERKELSFFESRLKHETAAVLNSMHFVNDEDDLEIEISDLPEGAVRQLKEKFPNCDMILEVPVDSEYLSDWAEYFKFLGKYYARIEEKKPYFAKYDNCFKLCDDVVSEKLLKK